MGREDKATWKSGYFLKLVQLLDEYPKCFVVGVDNVGSRQMQHIRMSLRGVGIVLMGKNTMIRKAIRGHLEKNPSLERMVPHIKGNVGFVFTKDDLVEVREKIMANRVSAPAKAGAIAPIDVFIQAQNTGLGPEKTSFFQALSIPTKISKGTIEIMNDVHLIKKNEKVGASEATLLNMLGISPFTYGLKIHQVYDSGTVFAPNVLDIKPEDIHEKFMIGVRNVAGLCLQIGYPSVVSAPHSLINGFKDLLAIAVETDITFKEADLAKEYLKDPSKFSAAVVQEAPKETGKGKVEETPKVEKKEEKEESEDEDMGFGLFD